MPWEWFPPRWIWSESRLNRGPDPTTRMPTEMGLLAEGMTFADVVQANWPWFAGAFAAVSAWVSRVLWVRIDKRWEAHDARMDKKLTSETETLGTLTATLPILAENGKKQTEILEECRKFDSDFIRLHGDLNEKVKEGFHELATAVIASACPEQKPVVEAHVDRFIKRKEETKKAS